MRSFSKVVFATYNSRSVRNKSPLIHDILATCDVLSIQETWHEDSEDVAIKDIVPDDCDMVERSRACSAKCDDRPQRGGGVAIVFKRLFTHKILPHHKSDTFESVAVSLRCSAIDLIVVSMYRPSTKPIDDQFFTEFAALIESFALYKCPVVVNGDLNIHVENEHSLSSKRFVQILNDFDFVQLVNASTIGHGGTIDLVMTQSSSDVVFDHVIDYGLSDHSAVYGHVMIKEPVSCGNTGTVHRTRAWKKFNIQRFRELVASSDLCAFTTENIGQSSVDQLCDVYVSTLTDILNICAPMTVIKRQKTGSAQWFDAECRAERRKLRRLERRLRKSCDESVKIEYDTARRRLHQFYNEKISAHWSSRLQEAGRSSERRWKVVDNMLHRKQRTVIPTSVSSSDFVTAFSGKISDIRNATSGYGVPVFRSVKADCGSIDGFHTVHVPDVLAIIKAMPSKQCSTDPVPTWLIKQTVDLVAPLITEIVNRSIALGQVPDQLKFATVSPRLKKAGLDKSDALNYRPISNLPFLSKVLEKTISIQLMTYLDRARALPQCQSAYRRLHSTETALLKIYTDICRGLRQGCTA